MKSQWKEEIEFLKKFVSKLPVDSTIKWGTEVYTYNGNNVFAFLGFKNHFTIWFYNGVFLKDPYEVLIAAKESTKSLRQWRFTSMDEMNKTKITEYFKEAIEIEKQGLKIKPEKFTPIPIPEILFQEFKADKSLEICFKRLSAGKQKEYNLYLNEAKQESTKLRRMEKIKPLILLGLGLNDKYKS